MEKITIETTQNVDIEYEVGSVGDRIVATIIDGCVMFGYIMLLFIILTNAGINSRGTGSAIVFFIAFLPILLYSLLWEVFMNGQSPGKRAMKIKVMRMDGRQPSFGNYLVRWVLRIVDMDIFSGLIALITVVVNGKGQRLGDIAAGTLVIKLRTKQAISNTAFETVEETYIPVFPQVSKLSDADASTIRQVLNINVEESEDVALIEGKLAAKLKDYLGISSSLGDRQFLQALLKDYNKISGKL